MQLFDVAEAARLPSVPSVDSAAEQEAKKLLRRALRPHYDSETRKPTWSEVAVRQRRNELRKLANYRYGHNINHQRHAIGQDLAWIMVMANLAVCLNRSACFDTIADLACAIGYRESLDPTKVAAVIEMSKGSAKEWWSFSLFPADMVGSLLEVTSVEREEAGLRKIGSVEETAEERARRLNNERRRKPKSRKPWEIAGIPRSTWYRQNRMK